jgi:hypothetical protein
MKEVFIIFNFWDTIGPTYIMYEHLRISDMYARVLVGNKNKKYFMIRYYVEIFFRAVL